MDHIKIRRNIILLAIILLLVLSMILLWAPTESPLVIAPAIAKVYAHDMTFPGNLPLEHPYEMETGVDLHPKYALPGSSNLHQALPITLSISEGEYSGAEITFAVTVSGGEFARPLNDEYGKFMFGPAYLGSQFILENNQSIYWWPRQTDLANWEYEYDEAKIIDGTYSMPEFTRFEDSNAYVDLIIRADDHIVGCMVLSIQLIDNTVVHGNVNYTTRNYYPKLINSVSFPMQDGEYQKISLEQVQQLIADWKLEDAENTRRLRNEDITLDTTTIELADLEYSLLVLENSENVCHIYRIYGSSHVRYIEIYETDAFTSSSMLNGEIPVRSAIQNTINQYDYTFVYDRLYELYEEGKTVQAESFSDTRQSGNNLIIINTDDMNYISSDDAQEILNMIRTLYADRGIDQLHEEFLPT